MPEDTHNETTRNDGVSGEPAGQACEALLDISDIAAMLRCSARTVYRLVDSGRIPPPVRLGRLMRWRRADVEQWLADGCPPCGKKRTP